MRTLLVLVALIGLSLGPTPLNFAHAQQVGDPPAEELTPEEREKKFKTLSAQAAKAFQADEYEAAIEAFEAAYEVKPVSNILYNLGRIHEKAGNLDEAIDYYERFVVSPNVTQKAREDALGRLKTLREVREMREPGVPEARVEAAEPSPEEVNPEDVTERPEASEPDRTLAWIFLSVGAVSLVGSGVFALITASEFDDYENATNLADRRSAADSGRTMGIVADSLLITGLVATTLGAVFWFTAEPAESGSAKISPQIGPDGVGVGYTQSF